MKRRLRQIGSRTLACRDSNQQKLPKEENDFHRKVVLDIFFRGVNCGSVKMPLQLRRVIDGPIRCQFLSAQLTAMKICAIRNPIKAPQEFIDSIFMEIQQVLAVSHMLHFATTANSLETKVKNKRLKLVTAIVHALVLLAMLLETYTKGEDAWITRLGLMQIVKESRSCSAVRFLNSARLFS